VEAYPELSLAEMEAMVWRMVANGANVVWIGHNNPGEVDADKAEPGLSYAVYEAYRDPSDPRHEDAVAVVKAQHRMLLACRAAGVRAVLPVGYQIQMGQRWNEEHPNDLRRDANGQPLDIYGGGVSASFHAPNYRRDIEAYYRWVDAEFVWPYASVVLMLNLADEPIGGDYSAHAEAEFRRRHRFGFDEVGEPSVTSRQLRSAQAGLPLADRQRLLGEFQSRYVVDYAIYSAELWQEIHPGLPVTMSFDGGQARKTFTLPDVEALFRDTPSNFVVTFDAYPRDGLPRVALSDKNLVGLFLLARSAGLYSARYGKPLWLWAAANRWGLSQTSPDPGTVSDAVANGLYLAMLVRRAGGDLQGIAYWNYNVKKQGLYNDTRDTAYDVETMFAEVSAVLPRLRGLMGESPSRPEVLVLAPPAWSHAEIGEAREVLRLEVQPYRRLAILAKEGVNAAVVGTLVGSTSLTTGDWSLDGVRTIVVLSPAAEYLTQEDLETLRGFVARGGRVVASPGVGTALADAVDGVPSGGPSLVYDGLVEQRGTLYIATGGVAVLFEDKRHAQLAGFWQEVLGLDVPRPGYRVTTERLAFHYHLGPEPARIWLAPPFEAIGYRYDDQARPVERLWGSRSFVTLGRREYALVSRVRRSRPWID
jgi:hypothetical protein